MENASKALIMAGEILIAVLVLSLAGVLIVKFGKFSSETNSKLVQNKTDEFNNKFYSLSGRINITADEIASLINYVKENNDYYEIDNYDIEKQNTQYYADVEILDNGNYRKGFLKYYGSGVSKIDFKNDINAFLNDYNNELFYCNARVKSVKDTGNNTFTISVGVKDDNTNITKNELGRVKKIQFGLTKYLNSRLDKYNLANSENYKIDYNE